MLDKKNRLKKKKEFNYIYKKGEAFFCKYFTMYVVKTKYNVSKIGFTVSNKVGNSVVRHRIRRLMSESIRLNIHLLPVNNYVFVARVGSEGLTLKEVTENFLYLFKKAGFSLKNNEN